MSYMESAMQDQMDGAIALQNQICDDACDVYKKTHMMASEILNQRAELLEALKDCLRKGNRWHACDPVVIRANQAITNAEK